jgi:hypothetical protein
MRDEVAIVESATAQVEASVRAAFAALREAETQLAKAEKRVESARGATAMRRLELGKALIAARAEWPERGPKASGWGRFLAREGLSQSTAWRYMRDAGYQGEEDYEISFTDDAVNEINPTITGDSNASTPEPAQGGAADPDVGVGASHNVAEADVLALLAKLDPSARSRIQRSLRSTQAHENVGDRDSYCTPEVITRALPVVDFDPCSNSRSTVRARRAYLLENGENGLEVEWVGAGFWNVPFSAPLPWAKKFDREHGAITMAGWLVNADHSPAWWHLLKAYLPIRLDFDERLEFVPPPGVEPSKNDRPQTLLMDAAFWAGCDQDALLAMGTVWIRRDP